MNRKLMSAAIAATVAIAFSAPAKAEWKPDRPVSLIIGFAAGGSTDTVARAVAAGLQQQLGQPVNVLNKAGAGGLTGTLEMARAKPDGYTIGLAATNLNVHGWQQPGSVTPDDFIPIALVNTNAAGFQVRADSPFKTIQEAMDALKADPTKYNASASGVGGVWHIGFMKLLMSQGINPMDVTFVPTGGAAPSLNELISGGVHFAPTAVVEAGAQIKAGQVRSLVVLADERLKEYPDVPTAKEALGVEVLHSSWTGIVVPKGTPDDVVAAYRKATRAVYDSKEFNAQMATLGIGTTWAEGDDFMTFMKAQYESSGEALRAAGMIK